ncbi:MAG: hypothetical protein KA153_05620 [Hyphomonadaceae bacterium]|nr:hypothetical protein [Hyphomonadaceae bacterium]
MANSLIFADGVRLTTREEIPGPSARREELWARVERANIHPGYTLKAAQDPAFRYYAEANVHASDVWPLFCDLSRALLGERGALLLAFKDDEPEQIVDAPVAAMLAAFEAHSDQLTHDGYIQFGIVSQTDAGLSEVLVTPSKYFRIWFNDERAFAGQMVTHKLTRAERLDFLDEFPHVTTRLPDERALRAADLELALVSELQGL